MEVGLEKMVGFCQEEYGATSGLCSLQHLKGASKDFLKWFYSSRE